MAKDGGMMDVIRCDEENYLVWKWRPQGVSLNDSKRANSIRWGSSLRVKDGSVAVFVYPQSDGNLEEFIEGPSDRIIDTNNFPVLAKIVGLAYSGDSPFQAEVYFINLANLIQVKFGVPFFKVFDPQYDNYGVPVAVRGSINFKIGDYKEFIKKHRLDSFSIDDFKIQIRDNLIRIVKDIVISAPEKYGINVLQLEREIERINSIASERINESISDEYGITISQVNISAIEIDYESEGYQKLKKISQSGVQTFVHTANSIMGALGNQKLGAKRLLDAKKARLADSPIGGSSENAVGMVSGLLNSAVNGIKQVTKNAPPPIPMYYAVLNGEKAGPYDEKKLKEMIGHGEIDEETLIWTNGMKEWEKAGERIGGLFNNVGNSSDEPPAIPNN